MKDDDIVELILKTAKDQYNTAEYRDNEILHVITTVDETITVTESSLAITKTSHPAKWGTVGVPTVVWNRATWGDGDMTPGVYPSTSGLVGYWTLRSNSRLSDTVFADRGTGHNNGTSANSPTFTTDPIGTANNAMVFTAASHDYVSLGDNYDLLLSDWSYSIWFNTSAVTTQGLFSKEQSGGVSRFSSMIYENGKILLYLRINSTTYAEYFADNVNTYNDGDWHHLVILIDRDGLMSSYMDNVIMPVTHDISDCVAESFDNANNMIIGAREAGGDWFNGSLCNARLYDRAITPTEIGVIYNYELTGIPQ